MRLSELGLGTHLSSNQSPKLISAALVAGWKYIDSAPNYGKAHDRIASVLLKTRGPEARISSKVGFIPRDCREHHWSGLNHSIQPEFIRYQCQENARRLGRNIYCTFLHNPEVQQCVDPDTFSQKLRLAFEACEELCDCGHTEIYGIATWHGLFPEHSLAKILALAEDVGGPNHRLRAIQVPVSLVRCENLLLARKGKGPLIEAREQEIQVFSSSPFHSGNLPKALTESFLKKFPQNLTAAQACVQFLRAFDLIDVILMGFSDISQFTEIDFLRTVPPPSRELAQDILKLVG